jgi:uracil-DNA glycosylase family 4
MAKVCDIAACAGCPIRNKYPNSTFIAPRLGSNTRLQVGDFPGKIEAELGHPFGGAAGGWIRSIYSKAGLNEQDNSALNIIQCRPPGDEFPTDPPARKFYDGDDGHKAVEHCQSAHVIPFLHSRKWTRVDIFGDAPLKWLVGKSGISQWRGSPLPIQQLGPERITVPTFHPRYIAKDQAMFPVAINDLRKTLDVEPENYNIYPSIADVRAFKATKFAFDIETNGWTKEINIVGLCAEDYKVIVVPFIGEYIEELKRIFINATEVVGQNLIQFDLPVLAHNGVCIRSPNVCMVWDTMLMHHLRFPVFPHDLEFIGKQFTNKGAWKADKVSYETYCARDVDVTWRSFVPLQHLLRQAGLEELYKYVSWPLAKICKLMTDTGLSRSFNRISQLREELKAKIVEQEGLLPGHLRTQTIYKNHRRPAPEGMLDKKGNQAKWISVPCPEEIVPWASSAVKMRYLYDELRDAKGKKLGVVLHIKTKKPTTDKNALDKLYARHKLPELRALKELQRCATLLNNFAKQDLKVNDVIHPSFNVHGTESGRLSSSGPNIQNQPGTVRYTYVPRSPSGKIISVDYSGIENRLVAFLAKDRKRQAWFEDPDFSEHKYLTSCIEGIAYDEVVKSKDKDSPYAMAKVIVHGSDRLMGSTKIAAQYDLDILRVKDFQAVWKNEISDTIAWQKRVGDAAARIGWEANPFGRKIWLWESNSITRAVSFLPQSTAADVIYRAMIALMYLRIDWPEEWARKVAPYLEPLPEGVLLLAQVHDELLCETENADQTEPTMGVLERVMTQPWPELNGLSLPIGKASGDSWGDCE